MSSMRTFLVPPVLLATVLLGACGDDDDAATDTSDDAAAETSAPTSTEAPADAGTVTIERSRFDPADLRVAVGTEVTWENRDAYAHTVTSHDGSFVSTELAGGATFSQTFQEAGTYDYVCEIHPTMHGTVVVG